MELNLKRPLIFFDLETTGMDIVKDRIVEISTLRIEPGAMEMARTMMINPGMPIPSEATAIHGITDEDVKDAPAFADVAGSIAGDFEGCDIAGYNSNKFDIPLLAEEFLRSGIDFDLKKSRHIDVQVIFHKKEQRTLGAAYRFYCNKKLKEAHSAEADTRATFEILKAQLDRYKELENSVDFLSDFSAHKDNVDFAGRIVYDDSGVEVFNFGKYKGQSVEEVLTRDTGYYGWIMNSDFPLYTKNVLTAIKLRSFGK